MVTKRPLSYWIRTSSMKWQVLLLLCIGMVVIVRVLPLEMQKKIINDAIGAKKLDLLWIYCAFYLCAVTAAGALKFAINALQTYLTQEALSRMRKDLFAHILSLPVDFFRKASSGLVVSSLVTEVTTASEYVGQAIAVSVTNILTLLAFMGYMFYLDTKLALLSLAIYPIAIVMVPRLQRKANEANKKRVDVTRVLSARIGETVSGIYEVHGNGSYATENKKYGYLVDKLSQIRIVWNLYRFGTKALNNFFQSLGPLTLFLLGGYLTIHGEFDLGSLVAFLSAYEKIYDPWKELMDFYQVYQDANVSYARLMEYFDQPPVPSITAPPPSDMVDLSGEIDVKNLILQTSAGVQLLKGVDLHVKQGEFIALVGFSGSGKSTLAQCIAQIKEYSSGSILMDGHEVSSLNKRDISRSMGVVAQAPYIFDGTLKDNLLYSCESLQQAGWVDESAPLPSRDDMIEVIQQVGLFTDLLRLGVNTLLPMKDEELIARMIRVREAFREQYSEEFRDVLEFYDADTYQYYSTLASNLLFGAPNEEDLEESRLAGNPYVMAVLQQVDAEDLLVGLGRELARQTMDILGSLPPDEDLLRQSPIKVGEMERYQELLSHTEAQNDTELSSGDRESFMDLALRFIPGVHNIVRLSEAIRDKVLDARHALMEKLGRERPDAVSFFRFSDYIHSQTILDNLLFGNLKSTREDVKERVNQALFELFVLEDILETILEIGMDYQVGPKGEKLSGGQRQKLAIARVLLKEPRILIMDEATAALDNASQSRIQNQLRTKWKGRSTIISVVHRLENIQDYDQIAVMKAGKIIELGPSDILLAQKGALYALIHGPSSTV